MAAVLIYYASTIAIAGGGYFCSYDDANKPRYYSAEQPDPTRPFAPRASKDQSPKRSYQEARCDGSDDKDAYANCQAWRSARAAEEQACIARVQTYLSVGAVGLVLATLIANAMSAFGALAAVGEMRKSSERQLRAYVFVEAVQIVDASQIPAIPHDSLPGDAHSAPKETVPGAPIMRPRGVPGASWMIKNSGLTPAYNIVHWGEMDVLETRLEDSVVAPLPPKGAPEIYLGPQSTSTKNKWLDRTLSEQEMQDIRTGVRAVYVYGRINYNDVFGQPREATYRLRYSQAAYPPTVGASLTYCQQGNDAD